MKMGKGTSIKDAWQEFRAKTTNQVVVRDCQTQTPNEQTVLSAAESAKNQTNNLYSRAQQEKAWIAVYNATSQVVNLERHAEDAWIAVYNATSQVVNLERHTKHTSPAKELELQEAKKVAMYVGGGIAAATVIGVLFFVAAPVALAAAGFTTAGIVAGSTGASMMSAAAIANGGGIAAGSVVAMLQSAGAAGGIAASTGAGIWIGTAAAGTAIAAAVEVAVSQVRYAKMHPKDPGNPPVDVGTQTDNDSTDTATKTDDDDSTDCITKTDDGDDD